MVPEGQPTSVVYLYDINLDTNQLLNARIHPITTIDRVALGSLYNSDDEGVLVYDITLDTFFAWNGNQWLQVGVTQLQLSQLQEAYNRSVMSVDVTSDNTNRTITLNYRDNTFIADVYKYAHIHNQSAASTEWVITHNLGKYPSVSVVDSSGAEVIGEVEYLTDTQLKVKFSAAFSGKAYLN
jgi:hypothetical protein